MSDCLYGSILESLPSGLVTLAAASGGATTTGTAYYYWISGYNLAGMNLATAKGQVSVSSGQKLTVTVNDAVLADGDDIYGLILSASATNSLSAAKVIATFNLRESDYETPIALPDTFELTRDAHFGLGLTVASEAALPSGSDRVEGMIRYVTSLSAYRQWNGTEWVTVGGWDVNLSSTTAPRTGTLYKGGCDLPARSLESSQLSAVALPAYESGTSTKYQLWLQSERAETGQAIAAGSKIYLDVLLNGDISEGTRYLNGKVVITPLHRVRRSDGTVAAISGAGSPVAWSSGSPVYTLTADLSPGYALAFEVYIEGANDLPNAAEVGLFLRDAGRLGIPDFNVAVGSAIFADGNRRRIVPRSGGLRGLPGTGRIQTTDQLIGHLFSPSINFEFGADLVANTADQLVIISGVLDGDLSIEQDGYSPLSTERIRAIVSTEGGTYTASAWTSSFAISGSSQIIQITYTHSNTVRADYPDERIAGNTLGQRNYPRLRVFVRLSGTIYEFPAVLSGADSQVITIDSLSGLPTVGSLPTSAGDPDFCLFGYGTLAAVAASGSSSLAAGNYEVAIALDYYGASPSSNTAVTKITHDPGAGCIEELSSTFADAMLNASYYSTVQSEGVDENQRTNLNFDDPLITIIDDVPNDATVVSIPDVRRIYNPVGNTDPTSAEDFAEGYRVGDRWYNTVANPPRVWDCVGDGEWQQAGSGAGGGITSVADVAALKAVTTSGLSAGTVYNVRSLHALFEFQSGTTTGNDDVTIIVATDSGGRWLRTPFTITADQIDDSGSTNKFTSTAEKTTWNAKEEGLGNPSTNGYILSSTTGGTRSWIAPPTNGLNADMTRSSATSNTIGTGSKSFTYSATSSNLGWIVGMRLRASYDGSNFMDGAITAVSSSAVTINVDSVTGAGTYATWNIGVTGEKGDAGATGSLAVFGESTAPTTAANQHGIYADSGDSGVLKRRPPSNGTAQRFALISGTPNDGDYFKWDAATGLLLPITSNQLTANRTYYVRSTGSDSNNGLTTGTAFLTLQKAYDVISLLILNGYTITIDFTETLALSQSLIVKRGAGSGKVILDGNNTGQINCASSNTVGLGLIQLKNAVQEIEFKNLTLSHANAGTWGFCVVCAENSNLTINNVTFGALPSTLVFNGHMMAETGGLINIGNNYSITGGGSGANTQAQHFLARSDGIITISPSLTVTITGTPSFATFAVCEKASVRDFLTTYSGSVASGCKKYDVTLNGVIDQFGTGGTYPFPGSVAGTTATGGQYR